MEARFATLLTCIDGRIQRPLERWVKDGTGVGYVDTITEPGLDRYLATVHEAGLASIVEKIMVSVRAHGSDSLIVAGHADCAGNPVADEEHRLQLRSGLDRLAGRLPGVRLVAVYAATCGADCWETVAVAEAQPAGQTARTHDALAPFPQVPVSLPTGALVTGRKVRITAPGARSVWLRGPVGPA